MSMTKDEIKSFASLILVAGAETTDKAIANLWYQLLANPDQWEAVQADPELLDRAFTEMLRISPPAGGQLRRHRGRRSPTARPAGRSTGRLRYQTPQGPVHHSPPGRPWRRPGLAPVSYTHLTLPTVLLV